MCVYCKKLPNFVTDYLAMLELFVAVFRAYLYKQCAHLLAYERVNVCVNVAVSNVNKLNTTYLESRQRWYSTQKEETHYTIPA